MIEEENIRDEAQVQRSFASRERPGTLYLVATPIGNLEDMTFRAIRTLKEADLIAAEDTRQTRKLLTHFEIQNRLVSYHEHNREASGAELIRLLEEGKHIALVSDAGMPAISDPGAELAAEAASRGIPVVPIPGANAALSALIISGLPTDRFLFAGFPPRDRKGLADFFDRLESEPGTLILYESPHRIRKTLAYLAERWSGRRMALVRELTKRYEEVWRGTIRACLAYAEEQPPIGECCLIIEGKGAGGQPSVESGEQSGAWWAPLTITQHVGHYAEQSGGNRKEAMKLAAKDRGISRRDVYQAILEQGEADNPES
ncbi:16S rRNA (cytidine(1402)-2'-O)-methyltransferase [Cohnella pontilimi]|uniref:Ribosomal RNA small subunit methyltransferase I n=1 Tax=Cohnella pontilimi TaxID=2564100 RepID=A0A4V5LRA8_9BACL|nr:16S rRNA (cytidine(1402)-2'-O)-methyltransferase [Cohnella pontilimi]TJY38589.1 16S rRNA (cytidine(1402)-2'-O)-methyltransferase [Cohnella pontilimi]